MPRGCASWAVNPGGGTERFGADGTCRRTGCDLRLDVPAALEAYTRSLGLLRALPRHDVREAIASVYANRAYVWLTGQDPDAALIDSERASAALGEARSGRERPRTPARTTSTTRGAAPRCAQP